MASQKYINELSFKIIGAAIEVHKIMGRGLIESIYHQCLKEEYYQQLPVDSLCVTYSKSEASLT